VGVSLELVKQSESKFRNWIKGMPTAAVLLPIQGISLLWWWIAGSYLGLDVFSSRSFPSADGWCESAAQGLGSHCWGDYYYPLFLVLSQPNPWLEYQNPYPAASLLPFLIAHFLGSITGLAQAGLVIFLGTMTLLIGWSVWAATKGMALEPRLILFSTLTLLSPPLINALDRGNSVGFIIPLLVWLYSSLRNQSENQGVLAVVLLTVIKPHFAVLLFIYLLRGQFKALVKGILLGGTIHVLGFLVVAGDRFPINIYDSLVRIVSYQNLSSVETGWPQNISFAQSLYSLAYFFRGQQNSTVVMDFLATNQGLIGPIVLLTVLLTITIFRSTLTNIQVAIILTSLIVMTSSTSYYYYAIFAIPGLLAVTRMKQERVEAISSHPDHTPMSKRINLILWLALVLTLIQLPMYQLDSNDLISATTANLVGGVWIGAYVLIFAVLLKERTRDKIEKNPQDALL
jgi:hypothetical protein